MDLTHVLCHVPDPHVQIVTKVINIVKEACPIGAFVKYEKGDWFSVGERAAREKVGACVSSYYVVGSNG